MACQANKCVVPTLLAPYDALHARVLVRHMGVVGDKLPYRAAAQLYAANVAIAIVPNCQKAL